jgi:hypothetical protein
MTEIWETIVSGRGAVEHGSATLFTAWHRRPDGVWEMRGSFWTRAQAERAAP